MEDTRLGAILLESRIIREEDLERCLEIQALAGNAKPLGQILVDQRLIDPRTVDNLLHVQQTRRERHLQQLEIHGTDPSRYLDNAVAAGANELHLSEGRPPLARVAGDLRTLDPEPLAGPEVWQFVREYMGPKMLEMIADRHAVTCAFRQPGLARGRMTAFRHSDGIGVNARVHPEPVRPLDDRLFGASMRSTLAMQKGLVLLTGERGNGLTETFASLLHEAARHGGRHILVLDDCLEYPEPTVGDARVCMRQVGIHTKSYGDGLTAALRSKPDVIFLGDASNPTTFNLALNAAESGTLVVATVHAASTTAALKRVISFYPSYAQSRVRSILASVTQSVVAVRLVPATAHDEFRLATEALHLGATAREIVRAGAIEKIKLVLRLESGAQGHPMDATLLEMLESGEASFEDVFPFAQDKSLFLQSMETAPQATTGSGDPA